MHPGPVEIDDTRLQSIWARQHRRSMLTTGALGLIGVAAILVAIAMVIWALRLGPQAPPVVNIAPPAVNVTVLPPQAAPAPVLPQGSPPTPQAGETKLVTEYTIFHSVKVDDFLISTGWNYRNSSDTEPYKQYCNWHISQTRKVVLGYNGVLAEDLPDQLRAEGVNIADATRYFTHCKWFGKKGALRSRLPLKIDHANLRIEMVAAGVSVDFVLDTGSSDVAIPADIFERMNLPVTGSAIFTLADGQKVNQGTFVIPVLEAGGVRVTNVKASVSPRGSDPLLGLSFLHRFDSYTIDRNANVLVLK